MYWVALLVFLPLALNRISSGQDDLLANLTNPCDDTIVYAEYNLFRMLCPEGNFSQAICSALTDLKKAVENFKNDEQKIPNKSETNFDVLNETERKRALKRTQRQRSAKKGLKATQRILQRFYIKLVKLNWKERYPVKVRLLNLLCVFEHNAIHARVSKDIPELIENQPAVKSNDLFIHRYLFGIELGDFLSDFKESLIKLSRNIEKGKGKKNGRNSRKRSSKKRRSRRRKKGKSGKKTPTKRHKKHRKNRQNARTRHRKKSRKSQKNKS